MFNIYIVKVRLFFEADDILYLLRLSSCELQQIAVFKSDYAIQYVCYI